MQPKITREEVVQALKKVARPGFRTWIWEALAQGWLDLFVTSFIETGKATNNIEAILFMADYINALKKGKDGKVIWGDVVKSPHNQTLLQRLTELITENGTLRKGNHDKTRAYGVISHSAISELFSGKLISLATTHRRIKHQDDPSQISIFPIERDLFGQTEVSPALKRWQVIRLVEEITDLWNELRQEIRGERVPLHGKKFRKLRQKLFQVFGYHVSKILNRSIMEDEYLAFLTLMSWASAVVHYKDSGSFDFFREVSVFPYTSDFGAGRLDALSIERQMNTDLERRKIVGGFFYKKPISVGHAIRESLNSFGDNLEFQITDWKFAVGDGPNGARQRLKKLNVLLSTELKQMALIDHVEQLKRYLSTSLVSYALSSGKVHDNFEKIWKNELFSMKGHLAYFTADNLPIFHKAELSPEEVQSVFQNQIVDNFTSAERRSLFRNITKTLANLAIVSLSGRERKIYTNGQLAMDEILSTTIVEKKHMEVLPLINSLRVRRFKDEETQIIEIVGTKIVKGVPEENLEMYLDKLLEYVDKDLIKVSRGFNTVTGGHICCLVHEEKTPSMYVSIAGGGFICFGGCGAKGRFAPLSIPDNYQVLINTNSAKKEKWATGKVVINETHQKIMRSAQQVLQDTFKGSAGEMYLAKKRMLDPDFSFSKGAGYATDDRLIIGLLDMGFTLFDIYYYGFIGYSPKVTENSKLVNLLKYKGLKIEEIQRPVQTSKGDGTFTRVPGLPYSVLDKRVTYPLDLSGVINSFYGRTVLENQDKHNLHRKLKVKGLTEMPHGAFNMYNAMNCGATEIVVEEAPINADTLMQKGDTQAVTGIVGVNNEILFEYLSDFNGNIIVSFNNDKEKLNKKGEIVPATGQKNTGTLIKYMSDFGFKGKIYDFTRTFVAKWPEMYYNDPNQFWVDNGIPIPVLETLRSAQS